MKRCVFVDHLQLRCSSLLPLMSELTDEELDCLDVLSTFLGLPSRDSLQHPDGKWKLSKRSRSSVSNDDLDGLLMRFVGSGYGVLTKAHAFLAERGVKGGIDKLRRVCKPGYSKGKSGRKPKLPHELCLELVQFIRDMNDHNHVVDCDLVLA